MTTIELTDEERAILAFVRRHFEENDMPSALRILDIIPIEDIRKVMEGYRELYRREGDISGHMRWSNYKDTEAEDLVAAGCGLADGDFCRRGFPLGI